MSSTITADTFSFISDLVLRKSAIVLESTKGYLIESRLSPLARELGIDNLDALVTELKKPNTQALSQKVVEAMTTNETSFFRDIHPFQSLKTHILPDLIKRRARERTLNIWSNACSSGQEAYTIAMLIRENFPELISWKIRMLGTDLASKILDRAKSGTFSQTEVSRGLPMPLLMKYFTKQGIQWRIADDIRNMVEFCPLNLVEPFPSSLPKMDIVFLRNVLIYFCASTKTQILNKVHGTLQRDGYLFLGGAETTINLNVRFEKEPVGAATCFRPV
jgi:chemotaxis protein methyltransferase CheR